MGEWIKIKADPYILAYLNTMTEELGYEDDATALATAISNLESIINSPNNIMVKRKNKYGMINFNYLRDITGVIPAETKSYSMSFLLDNRYIDKLDIISKAYMEYFDYKHCNTKTILRCILKYTIVEQRHIMCYRYY